MGFVDDNSDLNFPKVDRRPIPPNESASKFISAADWNELCQGASDVRDWLRAAEWYGLEAQAADPAPTGITNYIWLKDDGTLWATVNGTASQVGGGITNSADENEILKADANGNAVASSITDSGSKVTIATQAGDIIFGNVSTEALRTPVSKSTILGASTFNYALGSGATYIRGSSASSIVYIGDTATGATVEIANSTAQTNVLGAMKVAGNIGFYGTTPAAKPTVTGSRGGNAALASLLTALAALGLITDNTTA